VYEKVKAFFGILTGKDAAVKHDGKFPVKWGE
jgi:hypothetical protein